MTDNEIIKALECCGSKEGIDSCFNCPLHRKKDCVSELQEYSFDLIKRKETELEAVKRKKEKLLEMIEKEREKVKGYEEIAKVYSAYISILLKRLGATESNRFTITASEVKEAMDKYEARAVRVNCGYEIYYVEPEC